MHYDIEPCVGVGPLHLGMTELQVHEVIGKPFFARPTRAGSKELYASDPGTPLIGCVYGIDGAVSRLASIGVMKNVHDLSYRGVKLFQIGRLAAVKRLMQDDSDVRETVSFLIFPKLGINLTGFHNGRDEDLAVGVFARGHWDKQLDRMKPFALPARATEV